MVKLSISSFTSVLLACFVTFLWSTSYILIKLGFQNQLPALTFAGLRFLFAWACLVPFLLADPTTRRTVKQLTRCQWGQLIALGVIGYTLTQGAQFLSLSLLPAATVSLLLSLTPLLVAFASARVLHEPTTLSQWGGMLLAGGGVLLYFFPFKLPNIAFVAISLALLGVCANAAAAVLGRQVNRQKLPVLVVTGISMGIGSFVLLGTGITVQGIGALSPSQWLLIGWLAAINTALAFTLWNRTQQTLSAVESSVINGLMLPQIALLAWLFLDEGLTFRQILGLGLVVAGTLLVQLSVRPPRTMRAKS
jgi:drug/metabolite transporter (DMT)-like permease